MMADKNEDQDKLDDVIKKVCQTYGVGSIMFFNEKSIKEDIEVIPTGSIGLNHILGVGGLPTGRIVEIYGNEGSGKTTLSLHVIAEAHKLGHVCAFIDAEHALNLQYAQKIGVDLSKLAISQPNHGEQALSITEELINSGLFKVIVVDSVAALIPQAELESSMDTSSVGQQARLMSKALRKLVCAVAQKKVLLIFINQIRLKIGVMFGNPETTTGGVGLKFFSSVRLEVSKGSVIKLQDTIKGQEVRVKVIKNKCAPPFQNTTFKLYYDTGIDHIDE